MAHSSIRIIFRNVVMMGAVGGEGEVGLLLKVKGVTLTKHLTGTPNTNKPSFKSHLVIWTFKLEKPHNLAIVCNVSMDGAFQVL